MLVNRRLYRSRTDTVLGGVASGLAVYLNTDPALVRIAWAILTPLTGGAAVPGPSPGGRRPRARGVPHPRPGPRPERVGHPHAAHRRRRVPGLHRRVDRRAGGAIPWRGHRRPGPGGPGGRLAPPPTRGA